MNTLMQRIEEHFKSMLLYMFLLLSLYVFHYFLVLQFTKVTERLVQNRLDCIYDIDPDGMA